MKRLAESFRTQVQNSEKFRLGIRGDLEKVAIYPSDHFLEVSVRCPLGKSINTDSFAYYSNPYHFLLKLTHTAL